MMPLKKTGESKKIRGWLTLIGLGLILGPLILICDLYLAYKPIFTEEAWGAFITPGSEIYNPYLAALLIGELVVSIGISLLSIYLIFLFFGKKKVFPKWYVRTFFLNFSFILIDAYATTLVLPNEVLFNANTIRVLAALIFNLLIWGTYLFKSQRSKETFLG